MFQKHNGQRILTDFTGGAYRVILEQGFNTRAEYETSLTSGMGKPEWQQWYMKFKEHLTGSHREILKQVF